jgi:hypothetical protein
MKPRRVVIQLECETSAPIALLRKARFVGLSKADGCSIGQCALIEAPRLNVIRAPPRDKKRRVSRKKK